MKNFTRTIFLIAACCCFTFISFSQSTDKIHLHLDKSFYFPGETIWFQSYLFNNGKISASTNLYAALYNQSGRLISEKRYPIFNGTANGDFQIPDSLPDEAVQLRLFTQNMYRADSNRAYLKLVELYKKKIPQAGPPAAKIASLKIFPEGGILVAGLTNHVAFKAVLPDGQPFPLKMELADESGKSLDSVFLNASGLGKIQFTPQPFKKYFAKYKDNNGELRSVALPASETNGAVLHTEITGRELHYIVQKNNNIPRFSGMAISIRHEEETTYKAQINFGKQNQVINKLSLDSLPSGIATVVLSDADGNILQQKSIYVKPKNSLPSITVIERSHLPKGKNVIEIAVADTIAHQFSVSVTDDVFYRQQSTASLADELLFYKNNDAFYKAADDAAIDLVLSTSVYSNTFSKIAPDNYLSLNAAFNSDKILTADDALTVVANDRVSGKQFFTLKPYGSKGFMSNGLVLFDSAKIYYQLNKKEWSKNITLTETNNLRQPRQIDAAEILPVYVSVTPISDTSVADIYENEVLQKPARGTLRTIKVKARYKNPETARLEELDNRYASGMFKGLHRGYQYNLLDDPMTEAHPDIFSYLAYRFPGAVSSPAKVGASRVINSRNGPLLIFINETESPSEMLESIPISQIAYVKVILGIILVPVRNTAGAVYIYLKKGDEPNRNFVSTMQSMFIKGYDLPKEFSMPDYSDNEATFTKDYRSTLYWNPGVETKKGSQKIRIEYYNNDIGKKQMLILKGMNEEGGLIELRQIIE